MWVIRSKTSPDKSASINVPGICHIHMPRRLLFPDETDLSRYHEQKFPKIE